MKKFLMLLLLFITIASFGQTKLKGNKVVSIQDRDVEYFNKIVVKDNIKVLLFGGSEVEVNVETDENLQEAVITEVSNGVLEIYISQPIATSKALNIYVKVQEDADLTIETRDKSKVSSDTEIRLEWVVLNSFDKSNQNLNIKTKKSEIIAVNNSEIELNLNSEESTNLTSEDNSKINLNLKTNILNCILDHSANMKILGNCKEINIDAQGNGNFNGKDLLADNIILSANEKTDVSVNASKNLEISAENDTEIYIYDNPQIVIKKFADKAVLFKK
jgi:hypothetical protein